MPNSQPGSSGSVPRGSRRRSSERGAEIRGLDADRARQLMARPIEFMPNPDFASLRLEDLPDADTFDKERFGEYLKEDSAPVPAGTTGYMASLYEVPLLSREEEVNLFRRMNFLRYQAFCQKTVMEQEGLTRPGLDELERLIVASERVRERIIRANLRLVVSIAKRYIDSSNSFSELVSDGNVSLIRAVEKFDFALGFRFSTYATWAIRKNYGRLIQRRRQTQARFVPTENRFFHLTLDERDLSRTDSKMQAIALALRRILKGLNDRELTIVRRRFGLDQEGSTDTLKEIASDLGVCKERVRQLELRALRKLHALAVEEKIEPPVDAG